MTIAHLSLLLAHFKLAAARLEGLVGYELPERH